MSALFCAGRFSNRVGVGRVQWVAKGYGQPLLKEALFAYPPGVRYAGLNSPKSARRVA